MLVISLTLQALYLLLALAVSAKITIKSRSMVTGGLSLHGLFVLGAFLFCVVIPAVLAGLTGRPEIIGAFPDATGVLPVICLYWIPAFAFAGFVNRIYGGTSARGSHAAAPRFEDYAMRNGHTNVRRQPYVWIEEFFSLVASGDTYEQAIENLRNRFEERVKWMIENGEPIPRPGSGKAKPKFAPNEQVEALRPFVDEFWSEILGTSYSTSFVSNESRLSTWEQYVPGGRPALIGKVKERYGVDITPFYDNPIPDVLDRIQEGRADETRH